MARVRRKTLYPLPIREPSYTCTRLHSARRTFCAPRPKLPKRRNVMRVARRRSTLERSSRLACGPASSIVQRRPSLQDHSKCRRTRPVRMRCDVGFATGLWQRAVWPPSRRWSGPQPIAAGRRSTQSLPLTSSSSSCSCSCSRSYQYLLTRTDGIAGAGTSCQNRKDAR